MILRTHYADGSTVDRSYPPSDVVEATARILKQDGVLVVRSMPDPEGQPPRWALD